MGEEPRSEGERNISTDASLLFPESQNKHRSIRKITQNTEFSIINEGFEANNQHSLTVVKLKAKSGPVGLDVTECVNV